VTAGTFTEDELKAGRKLFSAPARFLLGVAELEQLPAVRGVEIAVAGRSNVGKSSLINALTGAKASKKDVKRWQAVLRAYLRGRPGLTRAFVLIDARHGVMDHDLEMFGMLDDAAVAYQVVLTKADKIKASELAALLDETRKAISKRAAAIPEIHATSAEKGTGIPELRAEIARLAA
jgi:GTP-binding protein